MKIKKSTIKKIIAEETSKIFMEMETLDWEEKDELGGTSTFYDRRVPGEEEGEHGRFAHPARQFEKDLQMLNMEPEGDLPSQKMRADGSRQFLDDAVASFKEQWESLALQDAADEIYARIKQNNLNPRPRAPIAEGSKGKHK